MSDRVFAGIWRGDVDQLPVAYRQFSDEPLIVPQHPTANRAWVDVQTL